ncbi:MAG: PQQ-binding-like beta-propeller repeat protein [Rhodospirillaceae bacterium]|jgi:outer membrane protein assembly factor BamB|nr:PQQ-binding-like beta-propeller repeat protein [Rhodospirillaceae bacterium]MBT6117068.1 PQQ-binding-like beta-propeller repeat protein [Rhodospirillaceae bacterium]
MTRKISTALAVLLLSAGVAGCSWFEKDVTPPLPGERIPVLLLDRDLEPDPQIADLDVILPPPEPNDSWPQPGGYPNHAMQHLQIAESPARAWSVSIGEGSSDENRLTAQPVVAGGRVYTFNTDGEVRAFDEGSGNRIWAVEVVSEDEDEGVIGGGVSFYEGRLYVATGAAEVMALDAATGNEIWRQTVSSPLRTGPTVTAGRVFAVSVDNQIHVLAADDGRELWSFAGITESAALLGSGSPAVAGDIVVAPFSSGELVALRIENGRPIWNDSLLAVRRFNAASSLADIRGNPVIDRGKVFAISHAGRMLAIEQRTGVRIWEKNVGGIETPWSAGDFVYVLTTNEEIVCLSSRDGRIRWVQPLPRYEDPDEKDELIYWVGPVLASDRLIVGGSGGKLLSLSPYDGSIIGILDVGEPIALPPVVANGTLFILTEDGDLIAYR